VLSVPCGDVSRLFFVRDVGWFLKLLQRFVHKVGYSEVWNKTIAKGVKSYKSGNMPKIVCIVQKLNRM